MKTKEEIRDALGASEVLPAAEGVAELLRRYREQRFQSPTCVVCKRKPEKLEIWHKINDIFMCGKDCALRHMSAMNADPSTYVVDLVLVRKPFSEENI